MITATFSGTASARSITGFSILGVDTADYLGNISTQQLHAAVTPWSTGNVTCEDGSMLVGFNGTENAGGVSTPDDTEIGEWVNGGSSSTETMTGGYQIASGCGCYRRFGYLVDQSHGRDDWRRVSDGDRATALGP